MKFALTTTLMLVVALLAKTLQAETPKEPTPVEVRTAIQRVESDASVAISRLGTLTPGWDRYLTWSGMHEELQNGTECNADRLERIAYRFEGAGTQLGNSDDFDRASSALRNLAVAVRRSRITKSDGRTAHEQLDKASMEADEETIRQLLGWLENRGISTDLTQRVRSSYRRPNIRITASQSLLNRVATQRRTETSPFSESILGTRHVGNARTSSQVRMILQPSDYGIAINLSLQGDSSARSNGYNGDVTVTSRSTTNVNASKKLVIRPDSIQSNPTQANASTRSQILGVSYNRVLGRRRAEQEVYSQAPASDRVAENRARDRAREAIDQEASKMLADMRSRYRREVVVPLQTRGAFPQTITTSSTSRSAFVNATLADDSQLAAPTAPRMSGTGALVVQIHESAIRNAIANQLGGRVLAEQDWASAARQIIGSASGGHNVVDPDKSWTVSFAESVPVDFLLNGSDVTIKLNFTQFQVGEEKYPGMTVQAHYQLSSIGTRIVGQRFSDLEFKGLQKSGKRLGMRQQIFKTMLRKRLTPAVPNQIELGDVSLPNSNITIRSLSGEPGWLTVSLN